MSCKFCKPDHGGDYPRLWVVLESWAGVYEGYRDQFVSLHGSQLAAEEKAEELRARELVAPFPDDGFKRKIKEVFVESV